ncbi:MAG: amidohydrolase family protein [Alphaproteobacteria bacterium]|jgi:imidazolonepropionase-like amidohydrolase|nr:amidohydrolase family protein [Rhodospirillaceae bacterium]MBT6202617.1 amidohydrolase family protein [Rhodospirillaceae bacterium]MBT7645444.1 amidohydrolase family protein [Rhodospirillaceae bacterium]MDG2481228.1 amidohydrolase family protein [Alphaproteobacteria bacterium]
MWLSGGQWFDSASGAFKTGDVKVEDGRITEIGKAPSGSECLDMEGRWLLPGFIDNHVHITLDTATAAGNNVWRDALPGSIAIHAAWNARRLLMCGITTARDVGGWDYHEIAVREAINDGQIKGARLFCSGKILSITSSSSPYYPGMYEECDSPEEVRKAARKQLAMGANLIKILASGAVNSTKYERADAIQLRPDEIAAAVEIAEDNHTHVAAHAHATDAIKHAVRCGCRSIEHGTYADDEARQMMVERGTFLVPTFCTAHAFLKDPAFAERALPHVHERYKTLEALRQKQLTAARKAGVKVAMGTDVGTPGNHCGENMQEVTLMVEKCGFSPAEAIICSTRNGAELLGQEEHLGAIAQGRIADIIAVPRNPLDDIGVLHEVDFVMKDGTAYRNDRA